MILYFFSTMSLRDAKTVLFHEFRVRFYIFKLIEQKMAMNRKSSYTESAECGPRGGENSQDWVCVKCNNLNFSFRKKCNRCKVQSREDNHQAYLDYYYYNHYYHFPAHDTAHTATHTAHSHTPHTPAAHSHTAIAAADPATPVKHPCSEPAIADKENSALPSVSPLVKKYKDGQSRKRKETKSGWKGEPIQKLFGEQLWSSDFQELDVRMWEKELSATDDEREEFIRSVEKMII